MPPRPARICRTRPRPRHLFLTLVPSAPGTTLHPGYLPLASSPPHAPRCPLPSPPSIASLPALNRPLSGHPVPVAPHGSRPGSSLSPAGGRSPTRPPDPQAGPAAPGGRWEAADQGRRLRFLPPHSSPSRRHGRRQYLSLPGRSGPLSRAGSAGGGAGGAGRKRGGGDSGRGPASAAPPQQRPRSSSRSALRGLAPGGGGGPRPRRWSRESSERRVGALGGGAGSSVLRAQPRPRG